jgi:hypothetical protein
VKFRFWHNTRKLRTAQEKGWTEEEFKIQISHRKRSIEVCKDRIRELEQGIEEHKVALQDLQDKLDWMKEQK